MSPEVVMALGRAIVAIFSPTASGVKPALVVGRDTRLSSPMLEAALTAGICSAGADVLAVGVLPATRSGLFDTAYWGCRRGDDFRIA